MYTVREEKSGYSIWKWGDKSEPLEQYLITSRGCNCPAGYRRRCKHYKLVECFKELEYGAWSFSINDIGNVQPHSLQMFEL